MNYKFLCGARHGPYQKTIGNEAECLGGFCPGNLGQRQFAHVILNIESVRLEEKNFE